MILTLFFNTNILCYVENIKPLAEKVGFSKTPQFPVDHVRKWTLENDIKK